MALPEWPELLVPDRRTLAWGPLGLGGELALEQSLAWLEETIASSELAPAVPEELKRSFERLRTTHLYGVLNYDFFTIVDEHSRLVLEHALRTRLVESYSGGLPIVSDAGEERMHPFTSVGDLADDFGRGGSMTDGWKLRGEDGLQAGPVPLTLGSLLDWARARRLLDGRRSKVIEQTMVTLRNLVAHPDTYHLVGPIDSARAIRDLGEIINRLWATDTRRPPLPGSDSQGDTCHRLAARSIWVGVQHPTARAAST